MIVNSRELLAKPKDCSLCRKARGYVVKALEVGLKAADPKYSIKKYLKVENDNIIIGDLKVKPKRVVIIGTGKASCSMVKAVAKILGSRIEHGIISAPHQIAKKCRVSRVKVFKAGHPTPDSGSVEAAKYMIELLKPLNEEDLVIALISGGGSALLELPPPPLSLNDIQITTSLLLKSGATIQEINTVRKHLSMIKGGQLAKAAYPATLVSLIISDVVGDPIEFIASGPTAPDTTTFNDAKKVLEKYELWDKLPQLVRERIEAGCKGLIAETPKSDDKVFEKVINIIVASNMTSLMAMKDYLKSLGLNVLVLTSRLQGEARFVGEVLASILIESYNTGYPKEPPLAILAGGETTVTVKGYGRGGRNQELVMSASRIISGAHGLSLASIGSDGIDGVTDAAGALADAHSYERAKRLKLDFDRILANNDSYTYFKHLKDHIFTGFTGTNVNDLFVGVVLSKR